ncbi:IclR family transcriptional regulator domain-containing protein [Nonomuraea sp. NPDC004702]
MVDHVQSPARGQAVIRAFSAAAPELTLSQVARATGLSRAAARRFLVTLADLGHVRNDGRLFALTPRVLELGYAYLSGLSLPEVAGPHLERLAAEVHESASVAVLDGEDVVYVARVATARIVRPDALRAELEQVRLRAWAMVDQELEEGLRSVAAPVRDHAGRTVAAVNVSTHAGRTSLHQVRTGLLPELLATAARTRPTWRRSR